MLTLTYRYRAYPTEPQVAQAENWLETCRLVKNYAIRERKDWIASRKCPVNACSIQSEYIIPADTPYPNYYIQKRNLVPAKKKFPKMREVHSQVLQDVVGQVDEAFAAFKRRGRGFPRFKKRGQMRSFRFPQLKPGVLKDGFIDLPKLGQWRLNVHRSIPEGFRVKTAQVIRKASGWYVALTVTADIDVPQPALHGRALGIDVGLDYFLAASDGAQVKRPRFFSKLQRKLKLLQRRLKHKQKGSNNRCKLGQKIARVHEKIAECRRNWHYEQAHRLCDRAETVFVEDIDFRIMAKGRLGKHTLDAGLGSFANQVLPWVCFKRGVGYGKVPAAGTSQECPDCGARAAKTLRDRIHNCPECGSVKPRDVAAAQVILHRGLTAAGLAVDEIACGRVLSGAMPRQDRTRQEGNPVRGGSPRAIA